MTALFGRLQDGAAVERLTLTDGPDSLRVNLLTYGATVQGLSVPVGHDHVETVVGFDTLAAYEADTTYQGCVIGRLANRIAGARFRHDGRDYHITANENGNALHGGERGLSRRLWRADRRRGDHDPIVLRYVSPAGEEGFPGTMEAMLQVSLIDRMSLEIVYRAEVDRDCPIDLTHHMYFNLGGQPIKDHLIGVAGDWVQEVDTSYLATGNRLAVDQTPFDLRWPRTIGAIEAGRHAQLMSIGLNQNWILSPTRKAAAELIAPDRRLAMDVFTDAPCLQLWAGLAHTVFAGGAVAIEPQGFIDAVNQPAFPSPWLRPGQVFARKTQYRFRSWL